MKSVQIPNFFWPVFSRIWTEYGEQYLSVFSPNAGKYGPEKTPYLDFFTQCKYLQIIKFMNEWWF